MVGHSPHRMAGGRDPQLQTGVYCRSVPRLARVTGLALTTPPSHLSGSDYSRTAASISRM